MTDYRVHGEAFTRLESDKTKAAGLDNRAASKQPTYRLDYTAPIDPLTAWFNLAKSSAAYRQQKRGWKRGKK